MFGSIVNESLCLAEFCTSITYSHVKKSENRVTQCSARIYVSSSEMKLLNEVPPRDEGLLTLVEVQLKTKARLHRPPKNIQGTKHSLSLLRKLIITYTIQKENI